jgi:hypothetical protein
MSAIDISTGSTPMESEKFARTVNSQPILSVRCKTIPFGFGKAMFLLLLCGGTFLVSGWRYGWGLALWLGFFPFVLGLIATWYYLASRVHFHSASVMNGWFVSRRRCLWSKILPYDRISMVKITHYTFSTCGVELVSRETGRTIWITTRGIQEMKPILVFLRQRLDKSVFDEKALKLLETGELEKFF